MNYFFIAIAFLVAVFMGWIITPQILLVAFRKRLFDSVGGRKTHSGIVPRLGGVVFVPVQCFLLVLSMFFMYKLEITSYLQDPFIPFQFLLLMIGLLILNMVGVIDDLIRINYRRKFVAQIVASSFLPLSGLWINDLYGLLGITTLSPWIGMPLTVFVAVFIINAVNLIDGIDGLCSGLVGMGALVFGFLFIYNAAWLHAVFAFITAGVLCPFFYYNVFGKSKGRQRIFMGDTGSLTLGLSMAFLGSVEISWGLFFILVRYCLLRIMKNDYLNMLASLVLPAQILDYFLISGVEQTSQEIHISLDEKMNSKLSNDEHFESKGFMEAVNVTDFPIRDHKVILKIRRRRWTDLRAGKSFSIPIDLDVVAKGTRYSKEFGAFLKETYGDIPSDLPYA